MGHGFYFRGRYYPPIAGGSEDDPSDGGSGGNDLAAQLAAAQARIQELEGTAGEASTALETANARLAELEASTTATAAELEAARAKAAELEAAHGEAVSRGLDARRRALIAEHAGEIVEELVTGATEDALDASIETAKAAYARLQESIRAGLNAERVPGGGGTRQQVDVEKLSPLQKITQGLRGK
jgi:chromosome segregation ATPase